MTDESALTNDETPDQGANVGQWNALIRRARIGRERKAVALTVSSYANRDGTSIHCGVATLAVDCEIGYSTARRYLAWLRDVGLIELVRHGNQRKGLSDEYRLTIGPDVDKRLEVPDGDEYKALKDDLREANRAGEKARRLRDQRSPRMSAETTGGKPPDGSDLRSPRTSAENGDLRSPGRSSALTQDERPPRPNHLPVKAHHGGTLPPDPLRLVDPPTSDRRNETSNSIDRGDQPPGSQQRNHRPRARGRHPPDTDAEIIPFPRASGDSP